MKLEEIYHSSSVNRTPKCLSWLGELVLYGSSHAIVQGRVDYENRFMEVVSVISGGHTGRVNCVEWVNESFFISGSSDGSVILWKRVDAKSFKPELILKNHTKSVTAISSTFVSDKSLLIASVSGDSTLVVSRINLENPDNYQVLQTINFGTGYALEIKLGHLVYDENKFIPILLYSRDDSKVYLHSWSDAQASFGEKPQHEFKGHEDWVQGMDLFSNGKDLNFLATCGQDCFIRIWNLSLKDDAKIEAEKDMIKMEEVIVKVGDEGIEFVISLETILYGHEDKVYQIHWDRTKRTPLLLSCSMDKTMIIWEAPEGGSEDNVWIEKVRVGETGGNTLGFLGCQIGHKGDHIIGYSFNGALHYWYEDHNNLWKPGVTIGGHFGTVEDIGWARDGSYLLSVSSDQTTRVHAPWSTSKGIYWHETARPNVHGHDLSCLSVLPSHQFVLGAEEKVVRAFQATRNFLMNQSLITKSSLDQSNISQLPQGASVPALGLSNKAVFEGQSPKENDEEKHVKDQFPEFYFVDSSYSDPPPEETLIQNTLWPEIRKLYGHVYEVFRLASNDSGSLVASVSKATQKEHASIILWNTSDWSIREKLRHHGLTVTSMDFSPCDRYLLSGSRDRSWALYEKSETGSYTPISSPSVKGKGYPHQRLIWSVGFSKDSKYFFTSSRDKKVAVWKILHEEKAVELLTVLVMEDSVTAGTFIPSEEYMIAVGLENGKIALLRLCNNELRIDYICHPHHKTVRKVIYNSKEEGLLASCSSDHAVKIFKIK